MFILFIIIIIHPTYIIHHIPVYTIISIKTNTVPIKTIKSITFSIVFWAGFYCFFFSRVVKLPVFFSVSRCKEAKKKTIVCQKYVGVMFSLFNMECCLY